MVPASVLRTTTDPDSEAVAVVNVAVGGAASTLWLPETAIAA